MAIIKYEKILDRNENLKSDNNFKALSFYELKNIDEIKYFIDNSQKIMKNEYSVNKIKNLMTSNKCFSYIYYYLDEPVVFSIAHIETENENKILKIDELGYFNFKQNIELNSNIFKEIINKAESLNLNKIKLKLNNDQFNLKKILKNFDFKKY
ncbi:MAG: hypothetical protein ACQEQF_11140 [Bacillota bacterium]